MSKALRNSNHELLRIIAMYMIVFIHANMYLSNFCTGISFTIFNGAVNGICNIGVSCFILISGYYGVKFSIKKLVKMECMMISYSLLELMILCLVFPEQMQGAALLEQLIKSVCPFITRKYWFYSCYICLFLLSGFIQKLIDSLPQKEFERLLAILIILFSVLPTFFYFEIIPDNGKGLVQMIVVYMIGRYIRSYKDIALPHRKVGVLFFILWAVNGISHELPLSIGGIYHHLCKDNSITNLIMAVILFYFFKELTFSSRIINKAASNIFAVFALNNTLVSVVMELLKGTGLIPAENAAGFLLLAGVVGLILLLCLIIGMIRERIFSRMDEKISLLIEKTINCHTIKTYFK